MSKYVDDYVKKFDPIDKDDWELVLREVSGFLEVRPISTWTNWCTYK